MGRLESELKRAPVGMNDNADPSLLAESRCSAMVGLQSKAPGELVQCLHKKIVLSSTAGAFECIAPYYGSAVGNDRVFVVKNQLPFIRTISLNQPQTVKDSLNVTLGAAVAVTNSSGVTFTANKRVRTVQYGSELLMVQDGGMTPLRYNGTAIYKLGITTPNAPTDGGNIAGTGMTTGDVVKYAVTYADELGRESSPSSYLTVTIGAGGGRTINWTAPADAQVQRVYLYRTADDGTLLYRVVEAGFAVATTTYSDNSVTHAALVLLTGAPLPGQNDPPTAASVIKLYKDRVVLNQTSDRQGIQISNLNNPSQFSALADPNYPADGVTFNVISEQGDEVVGFGQLGSGLAIFSRLSVGILLGDTPAEMSFKPLMRIGCIAPDTIVECDQQTVWVAEDGVYALSGDFLPKKISEDLDDQFRAVSVNYPSASYWPPDASYARNFRAKQAIGWYMQRTLYLAMVPYVYVFSFDNGGWNLDHMIGMPPEPPNTDLSNGYMSGCVMHAERQFNIILVNPGDEFNGNEGEMWVCSGYPLAPDGGSTDAFDFVYETRAIDGKGVHRKSLKRLRRTRLFGECPAPLPSGSSPNNVYDFVGNVICNVDGVDVETKYFDSTSDVATEYAGAHWTRDQLRGILFEQYWSAKCTGYLIKIRVQGTAIGRLVMRDLDCDYVRLN